MSAWLKVRSLPLAAIALTAGEGYVAHAVLVSGMCVSIIIRALPGCIKQSRAWQPGCSCRHGWAAWLTAQLSLHQRIDPGSCCLAAMRAAVKQGLPVEQPWHAAGALRTCSPAWRTASCVRPRLPLSGRLTGSDGSDIEQCFMLG